VLADAERDLAEDAGECAALVSLISHAGAAKTVRRLRSRDRSGQASATELGQGRRPPWRRERSARRL